MDFKVIWSDAAIADLHDIWSYLARQDLQAAERIGRGILSHVRILAAFPFIGPTYPRGAGGSLREIVFRSYRIFYDVSEASASVEILHVWHGAREEPTFSIVPDV
jgi:toxin ParE1/3/4